MLMKKILKLQDHKHTAKHLHHRHTSYRALMVVMALFGVVLLMLQKSANADSYVVSASVPAPIPTIPAEITSPVTGSIATTNNTVISGTCPIVNPAIVVEIYRNDAFLGSAGCSSNGEFSGTFFLLYGENRFTPKVITITNDYGPVGATKIITYPAPVTNPTTNTSSPNTAQPTDATPQASANQFQIKTETPFVVFKPNESFVWKVAIQGGTSPYTILVDWGDGTKATYAASTTGEQNLEHIFKHSKNTVVRISVKDATGKEVYTTVAGVTFRASTPLVAGAAQISTAPLLSIASLWIMYGVLVAAITAFWIGSKMQHHSKIAPVTGSPKKRYHSKKK